MLEHFLLLLKAALCVTDEQERKPKDKQSGPEPWSGRCLKDHWRFGWTRLRDGGGRTGEVTWQPNGKQDLGERQIAHPQRRSPFLWLCPSGFWKQSTPELHPNWLNLKLFLASNGSHCKSQPLCLCAPKVVKLMSCLQQKKTVINEFSCLHVFCQKPVIKVENKIFKLKLGFWMLWEVGWRG